MTALTPVPYADVHALTESVLRAGVMLSDLLGNLLEELPADAFAGESHVDVLVEMMTGTIAPVADAAGAATVHHTTALLGAVCDRVVADLRAALDLAGGEP
jgi:hypothetical protein